MEEARAEVFTILNDMYKEKNKAYGDCFAELYQEFGPLYVAIRLYEKSKRLKSLVGNEAPEADESIRDTLLDIANYAIMTLCEEGRLKDMENNGREEADKCLVF